MKEEKSISGFQLILCLCTDLEVSLASVYQDGDWCTPRRTYPQMNCSQIGNVSNKYTKLCHIEERRCL